MIAADVASELGLELPQLSDGLRETLAADLPTTSSTANPVDLAGAGEQDFGSYGRVVGTLLRSGEVDTVLLVGYLGGYTHQSDDLALRELEVARSLAAAASESGRPLVCQLMYANEPPAQLLRAEGVPVYGEIERVLGALAYVATSSERSGRDVPEYVTAPSGLVTGEGYLDARRLIEGAGVPLAECCVARTASEVLAAADEIGYPVVLKALGLLHKSDAGGVALGLADADALEHAHARMGASLAPEGYVVERMVPTAAAVELIVGCKRDPRFGPLVLVGLGGVYAEILRDVAVALAPAEADEIEELILSLRGASLLTGALGRAPVDVASVAQAAAALSRLAAAHPEIAEIEVNPLLATPDGVIALDARVVPAVL